MVRVAFGFILAVTAFGQTQTDWITQIKNPPFLDARTYNWTRTANLSVFADLSVAGTGKLLSFTVCPNGIAVGNTMYISGGTGTAEAASITASTCALTGGLAGNVTITTANTHTGAWTAASATGGYQEAVCVVGNTVGLVLGPTSILNPPSALKGCNNVTGNVTSGGQIFGTTVTAVHPSNGIQLPVNYAGPAATNGSSYYSLFNITQGGSNPQLQWVTDCAGCGGRSVALTTGVDVPPGTSGLYEAWGLFSSVTNGNQSVNAGAASLWAHPTNGGSDTAHRLNLWGINSVLTDFNPYAPGTNYPWVNLDGWEADFRSDNPNTNIYGISLGGSSTVQPNTAIGYMVNTLGLVGGTPTYKWNIGFMTLDNAASVALQVGAGGLGPNVNSQPVVFFGHDGSGVGQASQIYGSTQGDFVVAAPAGRYLIIQPGGVGVGTWSANGILPGADLTYNIGSGTLLWNAVQAGGFYAGRPGVNTGNVTLYNATHTGAFSMTGLDIGGAGSAQVGDVSNNGWALYPAGNKQGDLGIASNYWRNGYIDHLTVTTCTGCLGSGNILPGSDNTFDLGSSSLHWANIYVNTGQIGKPGTTTGQLNIANNTNSTVFVMTGLGGASGAGNGDVGVGSLSGLSAMVPLVSGLTNLGASGRQFGTLYVNAVNANGTAGVTGSTCSHWHGGICDAP